MGNCLVTKLKESVNNDNLFGIGELRIRKYAVENPTSDTAWLFLGENRMSLGFTYSTEGCTFNMELAEVSNNDGIIHISPKYVLEDIRTAGLNNSIALVNNPGDILKYTPNLRHFGIDCLNDFDLSEFKDAACKTVLKHIGMAQLVSRKFGSIENFAGFTALTYFNIGHKTENVTGNIGVSFGDSVLLENLYTVAMNLSGTLTDLASRQVANGRTSGTLTIYAENTTGTITVDGTTPLSKVNTITFNPSLPNGYSID